MRDPRSIGDVVHFRRRRAQMQASVWLWVRDGHSPLRPPGGCQNARAAREDDVGCADHGDGLSAGDDSPRGHLPES